MVRQVRKVRRVRKQGSEGVRELGSGGDSLLAIDRLSALAKVIHLIISYPQAV